MAPYKRVNSVAVSTARMSAVGKRLDQDDVVKMLVTYNYEPEQIVGIQYLPHRNIVIIKFKTEAHYTNFLNLETVHINGVPCKLFDMSSKYDIVTVLGAPFEMNKDEIAALLGRYGTVHSIKQRHLRCAANTHFNVLPDGTWITNMEVKEPIPSYLLINDVRLAIRYDGQPKTCRICGSTDHLARDCKPPEPAPASLDLQAFPTLEEANPRLISDSTQDTNPEPPPSTTCVQTLTTETDSQEPPIPEEPQNTEYERDNDNNAPEDEPITNMHNTDTNANKTTGVTTPTPIIKIRAATTRSQPTTATTTRPLGLNKGSAKNKRMTSTAAPPPSTKPTTSRMQLRPIKKRQLTSGTSEPLNDISDKELNQTINDSDSFIDLNSSYLLEVIPTEQQNTVN